MDPPGAVALRLARVLLWRRVPVLLTLLALSTAQAHSPTGCVPGAAGVSPELRSALAKPAPPRGDAEDEVDGNAYDDPEGDNDGDGYANEDDAFPNDERTWDDTDGDGVGDQLDAFPDDPDEWRDSDCDGVGDNEDEAFDGGEKTASVAYESSDGVYWQDVAFDMRMDPDGTLNVHLKVEISGHRDPEMERRWERFVEETWTSEEEAFALDIDFVSEGGHTQVTVIDGEGHSDSGTFYTAEEDLVIAHEIGHHLGLNDEYEDGDDPDRLIGEEDSLMRINWDDAKLYPRHFEFLRQHWKCPE